MSYFLFNYTFYFQVNAVGACYGFIGMVCLPYHAESSYCKYILFVLSVSIT